MKYVDIKNTLNKKDDLEIIYSDNGNKRLENGIVDLLLIYDDETKKSHFCLIRNLSALKNNYYVKIAHHRYICRNCLNFSTFKKDILNNHTELCIKN